METKTIALISISVIIVIALFVWIRKMNKGFGPHNLKVYGITLLIGVGAILALTDLSSSMLSPVFGLLGAIAGYLFGLKEDKSGN